MKAMVIENFGGPEQLVVKELPAPTPGYGEVLIRVRAFGINRAETYFRKGAWGDVVRVSGIECVGEVAQDPSGVFKPGETVATIMGGMGCTRNGSYAEYTSVLSTHVFRVTTTLDWADLAAIPESYGTAWSCIFGSLKVVPGAGGSIVIRGGTSAFGQAAINVAREAGLSVIASTRSEDKAQTLRSLGAEVLIDSPDLSKTVRKLYPDGVDSVLELVGNSTLLDSLKMARVGGRVCMAGFLGGGAPVSFDPLSGDMPIGVDFNFYASFALGTPGFPPSAIPMQQLVDRAASGVYQAKPARIFEFADIPEAHRLMETNEANGKIVVVMPS